MNVAAELALFVAAAVISLSTSWLLVTRLERLGERLGLTEALLGLVAALAADAPEITSSVTALASGHRDVGAGVVIGSNVFNLAALLGLSAIIARRIDLHRRVVALSGAVAVWVSLTCLLTMTGRVGAPAGLGLTCLVFVPFVLLLAAHRRGLAHLPLPRRWTGWLSSAISEEEAELDPALDLTRGTAVDGVVALFALLAVLAASYVMERSAVSLGEHFSVPGIVVGAVVLAAVTSLPNAVAAVYLALRGRGAATLSTALNSNSLNVVAGLLIPAVLIGIAAPSSQTALVGWWYVAMTVVALGFAWFERGMRRHAGWVLVAGYVAFVVALLAVA